MKFYIAASFPRQEEAIRLDYKLGKKYESVSRWLYNSTGYKEATEEYMRSTAIQDVEDVSRCEVFIVLTGDTLTKGGRHTESGIALALKKRFFLVGPRECVFHWLPQVNVLSTEELLKYDFSRP